MSQILASYSLYNFIFIEQSLQEDIFDKNMQLSIVNIASVSYTLIHFFLKNNEDIYATQRDIQQHCQPKYQSMLLDSLQDLIALDNNLGDYIKSSEQQYFRILGQYLFDHSAKFVEPKTLNTKEEDLFALVMTCFEAWNLLEANEYSYEQALEELSQHELEYKDELTTIINYISKQN